MLRSLLLLWIVGCTTDPGSLDPVAPEPLGGLMPDGRPSPQPPDAPRSATGRAYGISANVLGIVELSPLPSTDVANPNTLVGLGGAICTACQTLDVGDAAFSVAERSVLDEIHADDTANATTNFLALTLPGLTITATTLQARTHAWATDGDGIVDAGANADGSLIQGLHINGIDYGDLVEPTTITVTLPLTGAPLAEVRLLETTRTGDAHEAAIAVDALHVVVLAEAIDVVVAHADSSAVYLFSP